jgi:hypothetical protein
MTALAVLGVPIMQVSMTVVELLNDLREQIWRHY